MKLAIEDYLSAQQESLLYISTFYMKCNQSSSYDIVMLHINGVQIKFTNQWFYLFLILMQSRSLKSKTNFESVSDKF